MFGGSLSRRQEKKKFYLPGQEIDVGKEAVFRRCLACETDPLAVCRARIAFAIFAFFAVFSLIGARVFDLCAVPTLKRIAAHERVSAEAEASAGARAGAAAAEARPEHVPFEHAPIKRADIVDRNGAIIATSLPTVHLFAHPKKILDAEADAAALARILPDLRYEEILAKLSGKPAFVYLKRNLSPAQQAQVNALGLPGLEFENGEKRVYPHKNLFAHIVGMTDADNAGISGIEKHMDERLTQSDTALELSIDAGAQDTVRGILLAEMRRFKAARASAILADAGSGEIVAMVSLPDFDPNNAAKASEEARFPFPTKGVYEPGSVFKAFTAAIGLESGKIHENDKFDATVPWKTKGGIIHDFHPENRWLSTGEMLIYSSNIAAAQMAVRTGGSIQKSFLGDLGMLDALDIELVEKAKPLKPRGWNSELTVATVAFGHGISVTPLHLVSGFGAIVNGGLYLPPTLVRGSNSRGDARRVFSTSTSQTMRRLLRAVVTDGSGKKANVPGYEVAGKTGTANKLVNGRYAQNGKVMTSFLAAFPASNPKYTLLVLFDEPKAVEGTYGFTTAGWNAVPTASKIIEAVAPQLGVAANFDIDEARRSRIIEARGFR